MTFLSPDFVILLSLILFFCLFQAGIEIAKLFLNEGDRVQQFIVITFGNNLSVCTV